jgi:hypothetical protein
MSLALEIRNKVQNIPKGLPFGYRDLDISKDAVVGAAKTLERLKNKGVIKKVSKGVFYRPEQSVLGELPPKYEDLLARYLFENNKRIAYVTSTSLYNQLGLTTQMAFTIKIACRKKRISINQGALKAVPAKSYADVTDENYQLLGLLDALKDIKLIPDCSVEQAVSRLRAIVKGLEKSQVDGLAEYAVLYPARVVALLGAILEDLKYPRKKLTPLKLVLNPFTKIKLGLKEKQLPTCKNWNIK